jgi:serine/threonine protein kinase
MGNAVMKMLAQHQLHKRELRPGDSLSIRNDNERQLVKRLVARYRGLPEGERREVPALLNAIGKLEVVAGDFDAAQKDFQAVALMETDAKAKAEAHFNAYQTALERRDFDTAMKEFIEAVKLDAKRFAPFPVGKYQPLRILGAGGFGVAFLCRHKDLKADVAVKTLSGDVLGRDVDEVLAEARVLFQMDHPAIIKVLDCGYTIPAEKARPYFVMNFFESQTLEEYVQQHGPLPPEDLATVARKMAKGLKAAHGKGILHRDVKPANLMVRRDANGWQVKLIDFGLALKQSAIEAGASTGKRSQTLSGSSIVGTLDYAAPEQMGKLPGVAVGAYSDIYGFGKTCCYALFKTTHPLPKHWNSLPKPLAALLENCLEEEPKKRPQEFSQVLSQMAGDDAVYVKDDVNDAPGKPKRAKAKRSAKKPAIPLLVLWLLLGGAGVMVCLCAGGGLLYSLTTGSGNSRNFEDEIRREMGAGASKAKVEQVAPPPATAAKGRLVLSCDDRPVIRLMREKSPPGVDGLGGDYYAVPPITIRIERIDCRGEVELRVARSAPGLPGVGGSSRTLRVPDGQSVAIWNLGGSSNPDIGIHVISIEAKLSAEPDVRGGVDLRVEVKPP